MNKVILKGNISSDIEKRVTGDDKEIATFSVAVRRDHKNADGNYDADFIRCVAFGNSASLVNTYFKKGSGIIVEGRIRTGSYEKDGAKYYTTDIIVERVEFVDKQEKKQESNDLPF